MATSLLSAATSTLFGGKSSSLSAYTIHSSSSPATVSSSSTSNLPISTPHNHGNGVSRGPSPSQGFTAATSSFGNPQIVRPFHVGLWKVVSATHKTTGNRVSIWVFEKKMLDNIRIQGGKDQVLSALKKEASSLSRLRHPDLLQMIEPLEESSGARGELTFVTEYVTGCLTNVLKRAAEVEEGNGNVSRARANEKRMNGFGGAGSGSGGDPDAGASAGGELEIDEVEIQKGVLQLARALSFLHTSAKLVHLNLNPDSVLINSKGDWKLSGLSHTTPLHNPDGTATKYVFPEFDTRLPPQVQWKMDYLAPEYALDSQLSTSNDLYSLGCLIYAVHLGGKPPFRNQGSLQTLRTNIEAGLSGSSHSSGSGSGMWNSGRRWDQSSPELRDLLPRLITRTPQSRISLLSLPSHPYFSSLAINTLNFLDPTNFASKPREEKASFLKGLLRVLPGFSERLRKRKILPSLLEEMKDTYLLPFLLPNIFEISKNMSKEEFSPVLTKLQPLFAAKDPPQNLMLLLDNLPLFESKTSTQTFRDKIMDLVYNSLESDYPPVQEKVLKAIPELCEHLDYGTIQDVVLVKVAIVFTKTRILAVKVQTLECFLALVPTLNKSVLTQKLVPLLAKIKTKEPSVMMATLNVHEAMGVKVDREAVAELMLPQLWAMSMGPLLSVDQFQRFMSVIKTLGSRVEREHTEHLRAIRGAEAQTLSSNPLQNNGGGWDNLDNPEVDFATLIKGSSAGTSQPVAVAPVQTSSLADDFWNSQDGWGAISSPATMMQSVTASTAQLSSGSTSSSLPMSPNRASNSSSSSRLKARPVPSAKFDQSAFQQAQPLNRTTPSAGASAGGLMQPISATPSSQQQPRPAAATSANNSKPNYNITISSQPPQLTTTTLSFPALATATRMHAASPMRPSTSQPSPPPWMAANSVLQPTKIPQWQGASNAANADWSDFDPLK